MTTVEEVAQTALSAVSSQAGRLLAASWVNERYRELIGRVRFKSTRRLGVLTVPATISAGTISVARGASVVTGNATAQAAWAVNLSPGWFLRGRVAWYPVEGVLDGPSLQLSAPFAEESLTDSSYVLVKRYFDLPTDVRTIDIFTLPRRRSSFSFVPLEFLDTLAPDRPDIANGPRYAVDFGQGVNGGKRLELYPYSSTTESLNYLYREIPERLGPTDSLPSVIDGYVLKSGVLVDVMRWEQAQASKGGKVEIAALWRNDARAQETIWNRAINAAILADQGDDDQTFVWKSARFLGDVSQPYDIRTAEDHVWSRS